MVLVIQVIGSCCAISVVLAAVKQSRAVRTGHEEAIVRETAMAHEIRQLAIGKGREKKKKEVVGK
jgi:hypothetical protein